MNMECIQVREIGSFEFTRVSLPQPGFGEVLIRVEVTGLCRTDLKLIRQGHRDLILPRIPGEEVVGIVEKQGPGCAEVSEGERVYVYPGLWCGECEACRKGAENMCRRMQIMGFHRDGGFAQYVLAPERSLIPVPLGLSAEEAVFAEPLSCCLNALEMARLTEGDRVAIWGAGPAGTLLARAARSAGAYPVNIEPDLRRRTLIGGRETAGAGPYDVCLAAVGDRQAYEEALQVLGSRGRLVVFSGLAPLGEQMMVDFNRIHYFEQTIVGAYGCSRHHGLEALERIAQGRVPVRDMISHRMALCDLGEALDLVAHRTGMKILLYPWNRRKDDAAI